MLIITANIVQGETITEYCGIVSAQKTIDLSAIYQNKSAAEATTSVEQAIQTAKNEVINQLEKDADQLSADCVLGVSINMLEVTDSKTLNQCIVISAFGTAVILL